MILAPVSTRPGCVGGSFVVRVTWNRTTSTISAKLGRQQSKLTGQISACDDRISAQQALAFIAVFVGASQSIQIIGNVIDGQERWVERLLLHMGPGRPDGLVI
jgi:hypothetical protein